VELLAVLAVIGIILAFILKAAADSVRRAEERATQALITKLETGLSDRLEALLLQRADANNAHLYLAALWNANVPANPLLNGAQAILQENRAQVIAQVDRLKAEMPDVFIVQGAPAGVRTNYYPLNFAATAYPGTAYSSGIAAFDAHAHGFYPMGGGVYDNPMAQSFGAVSLTSGLPDVQGAYGATWAAAAGFSKQLALAAANLGGTPPTPANAGYDGVDSNANGLVDELAEQGGLAANVLTLLSRHTHKTARSEALYALLVEGQGPFGSAFSRDDFTDNEVKDTDGDGLLEFVDAWGEPLQFYRWPIAYASDVQKGAFAFVSTPGNAGYYSGPNEARQQNPLDPNQQLMSPAWWNNVAYMDASTPWPASAPLSGPAWFFQQNFFALTEPNAAYAASISASVGSVVWDRGVLSSSTSRRRAYYSRFLILSGGPDKTPGVPVFDPTYWDAVSDHVPRSGSSALSAASTGYSVPVGGYPGSVLGSTAAGQLVLSHVILIENQAAQASPARTDLVNLSANAYNPVDPLTVGIAEAGADDITNHNLTAAGGLSQ
jgi:hypothetical protein